METESPTKEEFRVQVASKKQVNEQIDKYKNILKTALEGQTEVSEETKKQLVEELLANFGAAVQANVLVNGLPWDEAPDAELEDKAIDLESILDETVVETTRRRCTFPKRILPHVVRTLKAEREVMGLYDKTVRPQEVIRDPGQESIMNELSSAAPAMVKRAIQVIKSINALQKQAEGLCEVLNLKPSPASLEIRREVFGSSSQPDSALHPAAKQDIKRAVKRAAEADGYKPLAKKPERRGGEDHLQGDRHTGTL